MENKITKTTGFHSLPQQSKQLIECLANPKSLALFTSALTVESATSGAKLNRLKTALGDENLLATMIVLISEAVGFFNLPEGRTMNANQVVFTAQAIIEDYPNFSLEDLALCFKNGKKGLYGKNYSTFDGQILMGWIKTYDLNRDEFFVDLNHFETPKEPIDNADMKKAYEEFKNRKEEIKTPSKEESYENFKKEYYKNKIIKEGK